MNAIPGINVNVNIGGGVQGTSPEFGNASFDKFEPSFQPASFGTSGGGACTGGTSGASSTSVAKDLLKYAEHVQDPQEKKQLIQAAMDLMGGGTSGANATPVADDTSDPAGTSDPTSDVSSDPTSQADSSAAQPINVTVDTNGSNAPVNVTVNDGASSTSSDPSSTSGTDGALNVDGNSVDTGRYVITGSTDQDGSLTIKDKQTGQTDTIWGDPHLDTSTGQHAQFQKDGLTINLPDGTRVEMQPTSEDSDGKSHLQGALISKDGQAVSMSGFTGGQGMQTSGVQQDSEALEQQYMTPNETVLDAGQDGVADLHYTNADGSMGAQLTSTDGDTSLDGAGGADPNGATYGTSGGSGTSGTGSNQLVKELLQQASQATDPQQQNQLIQAALDIMGDGSAGGAGSGSFGVDPSSIFNSSNMMLNANLGADL
jgi:hypothetical protein